MKIRAILVSLVVGALTVVLLTIYLRRLEIETSGGSPIVVLAVVKPVDPGTILTADMIATRAIPQAYVESRAVKKSDLARVIGVKVETPLRAQQTIMWTDLAVTSDDRRQLSALVQPGMRAVGIRAANDDTHFSLIRPGDRVDVFANLPQPGNDHDRVAVLVAQNVLVLAVGLDTGSRELMGAKPSNDRSDQVLTLSVNPQQLQQVSLASERGKLTVGVRNPDDTRALELLADMPTGALFNTTPDKRIVVGAAAQPSKPVALGAGKND